MDRRPGVPLHLAVQPWRSEPDTREGEEPVHLSGTLTASGLQPGGTYTIYRWDSVEEAFDYSKARGGGAKSLETQSLERTWRGSQEGPNLFKLNHVAPRDPPNLLRRIALCRAPDIGCPACRLLRPQLGGARG